MWNLFLRQCLVIFGVLFVFFSLDGFCDSSVQEKTVFYGNHIRFGPDFIVYSQNKKIDSIRSKGTRFFWGFRFMYEYLAPDAFYAGIDLASSDTYADFKAYRNGNRLSFQQASREFGNVDLRFGYTIADQSRNYLISPFLGLGIYNISPEDHHNKEGLKQDDFAYFSAGVRSKCRMRDVFDLGCNLKILAVFVENAEFRYSGEKFCQKNRLWGGEIGLPVIWHITKTKRWDLQFEPYFLTLGFSREQMAFGTKLLVGFNF